MQDNLMYEIELIVLFKIKFDSSAMKGVLWRNKYSRIEIFTEEFMEMMDATADNQMYAVMWIRWEDRIAYRLAVGYVAVSGFDAAYLVKKQIVLG